MKKIFFTVLMFTMAGYFVKAQITLQPNVPAVGLIQKNQLWNVLVINSSNTTYFDCRLNLVLRDRLTGQEIFCDGANVSTYDKASNELTITKLDNSNSTLTPQKIFTNFYSTDFLSKIKGEKKTGAKTIQEVELTPIDKTKPFFKVLIFIDKTSQTISSTKVFEKFYQ